MNLRILESTLVLIIILSSISACNNECSCKTSSNCCQSRCPTASNCCSDSTCCNICRKSCHTTNCQQTCNQRCCSDTSTSSTTIHTSTESAEDTSNEQEVVTKKCPTSQEPCEKSEGHVNVNDSVNITNTLINENRIHVPIVSSNININYVNVRVNRSDIVPGRSTITSTRTTTTRTTPDLPYISTVTSPTEDSAETVTPHIIPVPIPIPGYINVPHPQQRCCLSIAPCVQWPCRSHQYTCGDQCTNSVIYQPSNPCYNGCHKRDFYYDYSCNHVGDCRNIINNCSSCDYNFYESYESYTRCGRCFYR